MKLKLTSFIQGWDVFVEIPANNYSAICPVCGVESELEQYDEEIGQYGIGNNLKKDVLIETFSGNCDCGSFSLKISSDPNPANRHVFEHYMNDDETEIEAEIGRGGIVIHDLSIPDLPFFETRSLKQLESDIFSSMGIPQSIIRNSPPTPQIIAHAGKLNNWKTIYGIRLNFMIYHKSDNLDWTTVWVTDSNGTELWKHSTDTLTDDELEQLAVKMARWIIIWNLEWLRKSHLYDDMWIKSPMNVSVGARVQFRHWFCNMSKPMLKTGVIKSVHYDHNRETAVFSIESDLFYQGIPAIHVVRILVD